MGMGGLGGLPGGMPGGMGGMPGGMGGMPGGMDFEKVNVDMWRTFHVLIGDFSR